MASAILRLTAERAAGTCAGAKAAAEPTRAARRAAHLTMVAIEEDGFVAVTNDEHAPRLFAFAAASHRAVGHLRVGSVESSESNEVVCKQIYQSSESSRMLLPPPPPPPCGG